MDQSVIFKISDKGTLELAAAVVEECALKILVLMLEFFRNRWNHLPEGAEIGFCDFT